MRALPSPPPPGRANVKLLIFVLYIFYINISIFFLQNQFINGRGHGADTWSSPCGGAPSITQPTALFLTPTLFPYPLAVTAVRWGYRERLG